ncbi:MAG TPA: AAA family ATPase, partial [Acidimicrobiales bacterium]|nr:AAA family ATPase [Acidimicrobiales bacterium]
MKIGVVGKGGVGKTSLSGLICQAYIARGKKVLAVDTDSNPNLAMSLGLDEKTANEAPLVPRKLVVGLGDGTLSPGALVEQYGLPTPSGATLLHAMRIDQAGAGCSCADHYMVRSL